MFLHTVYGQRDPEPSFTWDLPDTGSEAAPIAYPSCILPAIVRTSQEVDGAGHDAPGDDLKSHTIDHGVARTVTVTHHRSWSL